MSGRVWRAARAVGPALLALLLLGAASAQDESVPQAPAPAPGEAPLVFRSVLDGRPRMLTIAFAPDVWIAFDTGSCVLTRIWSGGVDLDGPVYTSRHGPQPIGHGLDWNDPRQGARWRLVQRGLPVADWPVLKASWRGHERRGREVALRSTLHLPDGGRVEIEEVLAGESAPGSKAAPALRVTTARRAELRVPDLALVHEASDGALQLVAEFRGAGRDTARLPFDAQRAIAFPPPTDDPPAEEPPAAPAPDDAPVPVVPDEPPPPLAEGLPTPSLAGETGPREPGVALRLWSIEGGLEQLSPLVPGQTPNVSKVVPQLDLDGARDDFALPGGGDDARFLTLASGFLDASVDGVYGFRLISDDGSRLWLGGVQLIDHDGLHSATALDGWALLGAGRYAFNVEHFENGGDEVLALQWRPPGAARFDVVPGSALSCTADEVRVTSPGPKAVVRPLRRTRPGDGEPLAGVHPSFQLAQARPPDFEPKVGGLAFLPDGRLAVSTWDAEGAVWLLSGVQGGDPEAIRATRFARGLAEPLGLCVVDGRIFVLQKQELTELIDYDGDDVADAYRCVAAGWETSGNFHEFAFGLVRHEGALLATLAVAIDPGGASTQPQVPGRGSVLRIADDGKLDFVAHGLRTPNGIGHGADGHVYVTDNQGDWLPVSKLLRVEPRAFYGSRDVLGEAAAALPVTPPVAWLPQGEIGNSPSQPVPLTIGPWAGQLLLGDVTYGGLARVFVEEIAGVPQGTVFKFSQGFEAGINRLAWGPDGALYLGGIGSTGNWGQQGKARFGLQRLSYTGAPCFEPLVVRAHSDGFRIEFSQDIDPSAGLAPDDWRVTSWRYEPTSAYGGPKLDEREHVVTALGFDPAARAIELHVGDLAAGRVVHLRASHTLRDNAGRALWTTETFYTLNRIPAEHPLRAPPAPPPPPPNVLSETERAEGWRLLFDGTSTAGWRGFRQTAMPAGWEVIDGALVRTGPGGDIVSEERFTDFELRLQWQIEPGGNSGIFFRVAEDEDHVWLTGPEMQVLDNARHADGRSALTSAGANYALHAPALDTTLAPGRWNSVRLLVRGTHVEHWLNGTKLLEYELFSPDWERRVANSKFASMPRFGRNPTGHIALQDHGDRVAYRSIAIREL